MFLSIMIPSKRPEGLQKFMNTFRANTREPTDIEIIVLEDHEQEFVDYLGNVTTLHFPPKKPVNVGWMFQKCYEYSKGNWILFGNDDIIIDTFDWDMILRNRIDQYPDEMALFWPDDGVFGSNLSCFPIVSRHVLETVGFFPTPFRRYKIDDTLFQIFPFNRRIYIPEIKFSHSNELYTKQGGFIHPKDDDGGLTHDNICWNTESTRRDQMKLAFKHVRRNVRVMIGASTGEFPRRADFYDYMNVLEKPPETMLMYSHERSPARARNEIIQNAIDHQCDRVLLVDDDHAFRANSLMQLLEHEVDIVTGLYLERVSPHKPLIFDVAEADGGCRWVKLNGNKERLKPIVASGFGFILMKTEIFSRMEKPYVRLGELDPENWCDDIGFYKRAREAGIKAFCDMQCKIGHIGTMIIWPNFQDDKWYAGYDTGKGSINIPLDLLQGEQNG